MAALSRLREGQVLYTVTQRKVGNTTITRAAVHLVRVVSIDLAGRKVTASWNGKATKKFSESQVAKWKVTRPAARPVLQ